MVETVQSAREIGIIKKEQVINIIDSVVQRTTFGTEGAASVNIRDSMVQRAEIKGDEEKERARREREEQERWHREEAERKERERQRAREEEERLRRQEHERTAGEEEMARKEEEAKAASRSKFFAVALVLVYLVVVEQK